MYTIYTVEAENVKTFVDVPVLNDRKDVRVFVTILTSQYNGFSCGVFNITH